ncbi:MAG: hypothetical protein WC426_05380 [Sulfuriferula sp.]
MKMLYFLRVILLSFEAILILGGVYFLYAYADLAQSMADRASISEDMLKYLTFLPVGIAGWVFVESRKLVFEKDTMAKLLVNWPDYWRLKAHINATFLFAILFTLISFAPWFVKQHLSSGLGFVLFCLGIFGQFVVAASVYLAGFKIQELATDAPKS